MSIKTTKTINRAEAELRILVISALLSKKAYKTVEGQTFEPDEDLEAFAKNHSQDCSNISEWTDTMIEDKMGEPFFRHSMFNNYTLPR